MVMHATWLASFNKIKITSLSFQLKCDKPEGCFIIKIGDKIRCSYFIPNNKKIYLCLAPLLLY